MAEPLVPCASCGRHIRVVESACPFCGARVTEDLSARVVPASTQRLGRSALFAFAASVAVTGCSAAVTPVEGGSDAASDANGKRDAAGDGGGFGPVYGAPADDGGAAPLYGLPPPVDGGADPGEGGAQPVYGAPPPRDF